MYVLLTICFEVIACVWFWIGDLHGGGGWIEAHQLNDAAWDYQHLRPAIVPNHLSLLVPWWERQLVQFCLSLSQIRESVFAS